MFFQPHGLCFHVLENKPHPVLNTYHNSFTHPRASPPASPIPNSKPHKAPTRTHNPSPALVNTHDLRFVPHSCLSPSLSPSSTVSPSAPSMDPTLHYAASPCTPDPHPSVTSPLVSHGSLSLLSKPRTSSHTQSWAPSSSHHPQGFHLRPLPTP